MADMDPLGLFPASKMAQAVRLGQSRFYSIEKSSGAIAGNPTLALATASDSGISATDNITNITSPTLIVTFFTTPVAGDVVRVFDGATQLIAHTVTALEAGSATINLGLSALADGAHSLTVSHLGATSAAVVVTIDTIAPVLTSATGTQTGGGSATGTVSTQIGSGILYWTADTSATIPSSAQVVAGLTNTGAVAADHSNQTVSTTGVQNIASSGLAASTTYYFYYAHMDVAGNVSTVVRSNSFTTTAGAGYSAEATQYFTRLNTDPGSVWKTTLAAFIDGLVADGLWATFDILNFYAMNTAANSLVDLIGTIAPTLQGAPTFTAKLGYSGFSASAYVKSNFTPSVNGVKFTLNSASMSYYSQTAAQNANYDVGVAGAPGCFILTRNTSVADQCTLRINNAANTQSLVTDGSGLFSLVRTTSIAGAFYRNGVSVVALGANATTGLPVAQLQVGFVVSAGSGRQISLFAAGASRTAPQETSFNSRVSTLLAALPGLP